MKAFSLKSKTSKKEDLGRSVYYFQQNWIILLLLKSE